MIFRIQRLLPVAFVCILSAWTLGRVLTTLPALHKPRELADTVAYERISRQPLTSPEFWGSTRPLAFPLLLKVARQDFTVAAWLQLTLSTFSWGFLAWSAAR